MLPLEKHQPSPPQKKRFSISLKFLNPVLPKNSNPSRNKLTSSRKNINPSLKNINLKFHLKFLNHPTSAKRMSTPPPPENVLTLLLPRKFLKPPLKNFSNPQFFFNPTPPPPENFSTPRKFLNPPKIF